MRTDLKIQRGFTLIEMIVVIVITGIIASVVAIFIRSPVQGYVDSSRRAAMTDVADTALRRIGRDLRTAVPNSVRVLSPASTNTYIEFLPTKDGGRYRAIVAPSGTPKCGGTLAQDILDFTAPTCFEVIGPAIPLVRGATDDTSDQIVIGSDSYPSNQPYDKTTGGIRRPYTGTTGSPSGIQITNVEFPVVIDPVTLVRSYPNKLPGQRFDIVPYDQQAVTYACTGTLGTNSNGDGQAQLVRYWAYGYNSTQVAPASLGVTPAILANNVYDCSIVYNTYNQRSGLVAIRLGIATGNEKISLYDEIHVNNIP